MTRTRHQLVLVRPDNFPFVEGFREVMESLVEGFEELGMPCGISVNHVPSGTMPIVFGAHHLSPESSAGLPTHAIVYNLEQMIEGRPWFTPAYIELLKGRRVWDFDARNIAKLARLGVAGIRHVPIGYAPGLTRIPWIEQDIDILFFGLMTPHRQAILADLQTAGLRVMVLQGLYGAERDAWIARAKLVLNIHATPDSLFEAPRVCYLLANRKAVVSECADAGEVDADLAAGLAAVPRNGIVDVCRHLLADSAAREALAKAGHRAMIAAPRRTSNLLREALGEQPCT